MGKKTKVFLWILVIFIILFRLMGLSANSRAFNDGLGAIFSLLVLIAGMYFTWKSKKLGNGKKILLSLIVLLVSFVLFVAMV